MKKGIINFLLSVGLVAFALIGFLILELLVKNEFLKGFYIGIVSTLTIVYVIYESEKVKK
ncbi:MAG: hypothetical protein NTZ42_02315 [Candidatus Gribaldobacteria bacterium]|nr:hypothetical protein [Candidatus Gribaldobacteria bacterium]